MTSSVFTLQQQQQQQQHLRMGSGTGVTFAASSAAANTITAATAPVMKCSQSLLFAFILYYNIVPLKPEYLACLYDQKPPANSYP